MVPAPISCADKLARIQAPWSAREAAAGNACPVRLVLPVEPRGRICTGDPDGATTAADDAWT